MKFHLSSKQDEQLLQLRNLCNLIVLIHVENKNQITIFLHAIRSLSDVQLFGVAVFFPTKVAFTYKKKVQSE